MLNEYSFGEIYIRHAIDDYPDDSHFTMHIHEQCEIYFFISGNVEYIVEGSKYPLDENSLMIMRPAEAHTPKILSSTCYERYAINFPLSLLSSIDPEGELQKAFSDRPLGKKNFYSEDEIDMPLFLKLFEQMKNAKGEYERRLTCTTHLTIMLDMINRAFSNKNEELKPRSLSEKIKNLLHIKKEKWSRIWSGTSLMKAGLKVLRWKFLIQS